MNIMITANHRKLTITDEEAYRLYGALHKMFGSTKPQPEPVVAWPETVETAARRWVPLQPATPTTYCPAPHQGQLF